MKCYHYVDRMMKWAVGEDGVESCCAQVHEPRARSLVRARRAHGKLAVHYVRTIGNLQCW